MIWKLHSYMYLLYLLSVSLYVYYLLYTISFYYFIVTSQLRNVYVRVTSFYSLPQNENVINRNSSCLEARKNSITEFKLLKVDVLIIYFVVYLFYFPN